VRVRAKRPRGVEAGEWAFRLTSQDLRDTFGQATTDFRFATAVMGAAELFRQSAHAQSWRLDDVLRVAEQSVGRHADRREFVELLRKARGIEGLALR
jgi:Ca-activated chloride channel family protein